MNNDALKLILQSFQRGLDNESDPFFCQAFEKLSHDQELAAWFRAEEEFDAVMVKKFRAVPVELASKIRLLQTAV